MTKYTAIVATLVLASAALLPAADPPPAAPAKPVLKIIPGQVIVPTDAMRRPWGELVSLDLATRTGTFRKEGTDEILKFTVLPYAELLHHATFGDLQDFRVGERAIFRLHEDQVTGQWTWLTYIQDEMNMMNGHKEYFHVDAINNGRLTVTQANADKSYVREKGIVIETDADTRYWKSAAPAKLADIKVGDKLRTKTHGVGKGKTRVAWEVFLDDQSLLKFQADQKAVHAQRMTEEGLPGYVDALETKSLKLTLFQEAGEQSRKLKSGQKVKVAPAGVDRKPTAAPLTATVAEAKMDRNLARLTVTLDAEAPDFKPAGLARVWPAP
jgi:hypothetical protein